MEEVIRIEDRFYILAASSIAEETTRVLKHAETFLITDRHGDIRPLGFEDHGLFHEGTRFLSRLVLRMQERSPLLLSSTITEDNDFLMADLTNPDFDSEGGTLVRKGSIHLHRTVFLWEGRCYEGIKITNFALHPVEFSFSVEFDADFVDIFEVRGVKRLRRGSMLEPVLKDGEVVLGYSGLDGVVRRTRIGFSPPPDRLGMGRAVFRLRLAPHEEAEYRIVTSAEIEGLPSPSVPFEQAFREVKETYRRHHESACIVETSNEQFNDWLNRSRADVFMMLTDTPFGPYPYAGIPWYNTVFGRDGIITALETLWLCPEIARGVLGFLASNQADAVIPEQDAEPGKILHELRRGEMAALGEIPFGRYYGTVDATPLFVVLAGYYYERTGERGFMERLWPGIERAIEWIDSYGDLDGDGFVEYVRRSGTGLGNQGWKDSEDSIFHEDGTLASPPIALCEVQGYVYEAKEKAARIALALGRDREAERLRREAGALREAFLRSFWCEEEGVYALALDADKRPCRVRSSNTGHCLFSGIASEGHARSIVEGLMDEDFFTGWGIRTIASGQARYNPMSYHNGSVWPHDNALIASGMARYGFKEEAMRVLAGLFDASLFLDLHRLPELFCGFKRRRGEGPTLYPVACDPQSWASGTAFLLIQACLGLSIQAPDKRIYFNSPVLPPFLQRVTIKNLRVGKAALDLVFTRHEQDVGINVVRKEGEVEIVIRK